MAVDYRPWTVPGEATDGVASTLRIDSSYYSQFAGDVAYNKSAFDEMSTGFGIVTNLASSSENSRSPLG